MTKLLSKAFKKASALPESLQNEIAQALLDEIEWVQSTFKQKKSEDRNMKDRKIVYKMLRSSINTVKCSFFCPIIFLSFVR